MSEQVKSQSKGKPHDQGINDMPSGLLPSLRHTPTGSKTAGTPPDTSERIVSFKNLIPSFHFSPLCVETLNWCLGIMCTFISEADRFLGDGTVW